MFTNINNHCEQTSSTFCSRNRAIAAQQFHHFWSKIHIQQRYTNIILEKKWRRSASVKLCVTMADRHGEFTTHQPSPPVCLVVICVDVKKKKKILKKCPTFFPCRSQPKRKNPRKKLADPSKIHLKKIAL